MVKKLDLQLAVTFLREDNRYIAYSPALDLSTSGKTFEEAKRRFREAAHIFFEETMANGTITEVLQELGWKKVQAKWQPPVLISQESIPISV
ncbi:MAG: hypothetical protein A3E07_01540 [Candidatus Wildermuthbacteria bacterium RIFCSPHIGHO2_12_FULL_45_9]|uniref:HicB-like antitoxin of toxin-antitoxin system domain-containing protein n=1 Tax=Candidatus Wildermuthbacteria bacterium RIFCSPHIGHO2_02_FULL_45_25 TaxID=1802450 RepID=A0A1G2R4E7_9BACT|nr:MAG: hypothetical protein A2748_03640 [Candidatus Wildermuthbacteria bacterium RIFCSPHIGHO2_01_FULL_45_20]OHA67730.1 MAG: hypothetical protein A3C04_00380 [Candidatus Wildermuthbacteria bacterium RIFCSPHIGHO2_02_FULL_45_25]OHA71862.1 MAG: hypothetical protein A3E07_01540 [Candidatus Wildermuthbacteria bacterium RIFCSPHIGHO2_12_FULL_45_9]